MSNRIIKSGLCLLLGTLGFAATFVYQARDISSDLSHTKTTKEQVASNSTLKIKTDTIDELNNPNHSNICNDSNKPNILNNLDKLINKNSAKITNEDLGIKRDLVHKIEYLANTSKDNKHNNNNNNNNNQQSFYTQNIVLHLSRVPYKNAKVSYQNTKKESPIILSKINEEGIGFNEYVRKFLRDSKEEQRKNSEIKDKNTQFFNIPTEFVLTRSDYAKHLFSKELNFKAKTKYMNIFGIKVKYNSSSEAEDNAQNKDYYTKITKNQGLHQADLKLNDSMQTTVIYLDLKKKSTLEAKSIKFGTKMMGGAKAITIEYIRRFE